MAGPVFRETMDVSTPNSTIQNNSSRLVTVIRTCGFCSDFHFSGNGVLQDFVSSLTGFTSHFPRLLMAITNDACQLPASVLQLPDM